jgi:hypothetical protein
MSKTTNILILLTLLQQFLGYANTNTPDPSPALSENGADSDISDFIICPGNCLACLSSSICTWCMSGYYIFEGFGQAVCNPCPDNCVNCQNYVGCQGCKHGYYLWNLTFANTCYICDSPCLSCHDMVGCTQCKSGYFVYNRSSGAGCDNCPEGCETCSDRNTCLDTSGSFLHSASLVYLILICVLIL